MREEIDASDRLLLNLLQEDGRTANAELSRRIGLAPSATLERVRRLVNRGLIRRFTAILDRLRCSFGVCAFITVRTSEPLRAEAVVRRLTAIPEVLELHDVAGADCYLLKVVASDLEHLHRLIHERLGEIKEIRSTTTMIVLQTFKETTALPLPRPESPR